jgi:lipase chaperone LimK
MTPTRRIVDVAGQQAQLLTERVPGYRSEAVKALVQVIQLQQEGLGPQSRRDRVQKLLGDLGTKVLIQDGDQ